MGKISLRAQQENVRRKVEETMEGAVIHQRQQELASGRWDFVVFGPSPDGQKSVVRVGVAEQMMIQQAGIYLASVGDPEAVGQPGMMSIEDLADGDISEDLRGLEVYHVAPLRPLMISAKTSGDDLNHVREKVFEDYADANIAIIETPDEEAWSVAVLRYLHECDEAFPDPVMSVIRGNMRSPLADGPPGGKMIH